MDKKSKIVFALFILMIIAATGLSFYRYFIRENYYIRAQVSCDPAIQNCFEHICDPEAEEGCSSVISERTSYYKFIEKKAYLIPRCDPQVDPSCDPMFCASGSDCREIICDGSIVTEGDHCATKP